MHARISRAGGLPATVTLTVRRQETAVKTTKLCVRGQVSSQAGEKHGFTPTPFPACLSHAGTDQPGFIQGACRDCFFSQ